MGRVFCDEMTRVNPAPIVAFASRRVTEEPAIFVSAVGDVREIAALPLASPPALQAPCEAICEEKRLVTASTCYVVPDGDNAAWKPCGRNCGGVQRNVRGPPKFQYFVASTVGFALQLYCA